MGADLLVDERFVGGGFGGELDEEVAGVDEEEGGEEGGVGDVEGVDGVAVSAWTGVHADVGELGGGEAGKDAARVESASAGTGAKKGGVGVEEKTYRLISEMKVSRSLAPVHGFLGSFLQARRPSADGQPDRRMHDAWRKTDLP